VLGILPPGLESMAGVGIEAVRLSYRNCESTASRTVLLSFAEHSIAQDARRLGTA
jgi:hypothetical protein